MHGCDLMINIGARFDDRITGRIDAFSPGSQGAYRHRPLVDQQGDPDRFPDHRRRGHVLEEMLRIWKARGRKTNSEAVAKWWAQIEEWREVELPAYTNSEARPSNRNTRWSGWRR
jgi:acetolactate synthase-1/2/3 large subunit